MLCGVVVMGHLGLALLPVLLMTIDGGLFPILLDYLSIENPNNACGGLQGQLDMPWYTPMQHNSMMLRLSWS
jgi:hypothetical protein